MPEAVTAEARRSSAKVSDPTWDHLLAELARIDLLIRYRVAQVREGPGADEDFRGLYVSEADVDRLLREPLGALPWSDADLPLASETFARLHERLRSEIEDRRRNSRAGGAPDRVDELRRRFELTPFETDTLLLCLAPEIDPRYDRLYAYLHDDVTRRRPSVQLALSLLCPTLSERMVSRRYFASGAALRRARLLDVVEDPHRPGGSLLSRDLRIAERVAAFVFDSDAVDQDLGDAVELIDEAERVDHLVLPRSLRGRIASLLAEDGVARESCVLHLQGNEGSGRRALAAAMSGALGKPLLLADVGTFGAGESRGEGWVRLVHREAVLQGAHICWYGVDQAHVNGNAAFVGSIVRIAAAVDGPTFLIGQAPWRPSSAMGIPWLSLRIPDPTPAERISLWKGSLDGVSLSKDVDLAMLAGAFRLNGGQISESVAAARAYAGARRDGISMEDLNAGARSQVSHHLARLAHRVEPHHTWQDIVLPDDRLRQLHEICDRLRYRAMVFDEWGFDRKLSLGKGLNLLFAGPSGTGKTMASSIIASELSLELYKIDLASMVSKYIGETEKNLSEIFREAEASNVVLFFDEADALFGKRTEVRDSHDRYANIETSYLLQRMEEYEGVVILATNLRKNMDDAFVRRIHFTIEFPFPSASERERIWRAIWPEEMPRANDLDYDLLADRMELTGGNIRNIALGAAFLAAADGGKVKMPHVLHAARREYQKMGTILADDDVGWIRTAGSP